MSIKITPFQEHLSFRKVAGDDKPNQIDQFDINQLSGIIKHYLHNESNKYDQQGPSLQGLLKCLVNQLPQKNESENIKKLNELIAAENDLEIEIKDKQLSGEKQVEHFMKTQLSILSIVTEIYLKHLSPKSTHHPIFKEYNRLAKKCLVKFDNNYFGTMKKVNDRKKYFYEGTGKLFNIKFIFDIFTELTSIKELHLTIHANYFDQYKDSLDSHLDGMLGNRSDTGDINIIELGTDENRYRVPKSAFEALANANHSNFESSEVRDHVLKRAIELLKTDGNHNQDLLNELTIKYSLAQSEKARSFVYSNEYPNFDKLDFDMDYLRDGGARTGHTIGSYIILMKGDGALKTLLWEAGEPNIDEKFKQIKSHFEAVKLSSLYSSDRKWINGEFSHIGAIEPHKEMLASELSDFNSKKGTGVFGRLSNWWNSIDDDGLSSVLNNSHALFASDRIEINALTESPSFSVNKPTLFDINTDTHFYMAMSYTFNGNDYVTILDREKDEHVTLTLADANNWLSNKNLEQLPSNKLKSSDDPFAGIKSLKRSKFGKCTFSNQKGMLKYVMWLMMVQEKKRFLNKDEKGLMEDLYKEFTTSFRAAQVDRVMESSNEQNNDLLNQIEAKYRSNPKRKTLIDRMEHIQNSRSS